MISNDEILQMCNDIGYNIFNQGKLRFEFNMTNFNIKARVKKNKHGFTIMEIVKVNLKEIKVEEIEIYHPSFEELKKSDKAKLRTYTYLNNNSGDRIVDNTIDGANNFDESINEELITHEYINMPKVKKEKTRIGNLRISEDNNTKKYIKQDDNLRTLSSEGGIRKAKGIEFSEVDKNSISAELISSILDLKKLEKLDWIRKVNIKIVKLPLGRKFSYLSNGVDRRMCLIAEILKVYSNIFGIIEVERENEALSMLILKFKSKKGLQFAYEYLLNGLIQESGKWISNVINKLNNVGISICRKKHMNNKIDNIIKEIGK